VNATRPHARHNQQREEPIVIEIKRWTDGRVLYTAENASDVRTALEEAVRAGAKLNDAKLNGAKLNDAKLNDAELNGAKLNGAELNGAELNGAELNGAKLNGAELNGAKLNDAKLNGAKLNGAKLNGAKLNGAKLNDVLTPSHALWVFRQDLWSILDMAPREVMGLRLAIVDGRIDGSTYRGDCACLVGTIANMRGVSVDGGALGIPTDSSRPAEQWFMPIREGMVPADLASAEDRSEGEFRAAWAVRWIDEWVVSRKAISGALAA
jgi:Pentapeptide repeats (8 copies)